MTYFGGLWPECGPHKVFLTTTEEFSCSGLIEVLDCTVRHFIFLPVIKSRQLSFATYATAYALPLYQLGSPPLNGIRCLATAYCHVNSFRKTAVINFSAAVQGCGLRQCCLDDIAFASLRIVTTFSCLASHPVAFFLRPINKLCMAFMVWDNTITAHNGVTLPLFR